MLDYELERKMNQEERIAEIKKLLKKEHKLTTRQLAQHFKYPLIQQEEMCSD